MVSKSKKQTLPKHEQDYVFVERQDQDYASIKLTSGPFTDIIYHYGNVQFAKEENEDGNLPMKFDYTVDKNYQNADTDSQEFINHIGDILVTVMDQELNGRKN
tara:strand:- start:1074 stop:1382 length:309 start_codon:yes stop_codon:yes gene_type:complete